MLVERTDRIVDCDISFQGDANGHEDGCAHGDAHAGIKQVGKEEGVEIGSKGEGSPEAFQDASKEVPGVETDERHQQKIETVAHLIPEKE